MDTVKYFELNNEKKIIFIKLNNFIVYNKLQNVLKITKSLIDPYCKSWDTYKKLNNKYEYIYNSNKTLGLNFKPISRSYFKLHEIVHDHDIILDGKLIFCMAESPGGFIKNILDNTSSTHVYANSLSSPNRSIPSWNDAILKSNNVDILNGVDKTGNICNINNINNIIETIGYNKCDIITADGGIDYSNNYNNQELDSYDLILSEIYLALNLQKCDGVFILKVFDIFYYNTIQLLYILHLFYDNVYIAKLDTSRPSNSEKYIVCKGFKINNDNTIIINKIKDYIECNICLDLFVPIDFIISLYTYIDFFNNQQIHNINSTINLIKQKYNNNLIIFNHLENAKKWYKKYNIKNI
jgi:23S rRNA U2552 (ribose-2'-O)-methylase RlmE/FtsJ